MSLWVADQFIFELIKRKLYSQKTEILVMGLSFKENCPDIRNTKVIDLINHLKKFDLNVSVFDPHVNKEEVLRKFNINILGNIPKNKKFKGVIMAVAHEQFKKLKNEQWGNLLEKKAYFLILKILFLNF